MGGWWVGWVGGWWWVLGGGGCWVKKCLWLCAKPHDDLCSCVIPTWSNNKTNQHQCHSQEPRVSLLRMHLPVISLKTTVRLSIASYSQKINVRYILQSYVTCTKYHPTACFLEILEIHFKLSHLKNLLHPDLAQ